MMLYLPRCNGKTVATILTAYKEGNPIIVPSIYHKNNMLNTAREIGFAGKVEVFTNSEWLEHLAKQHERKEGKKHGF